MAEDVKPTTQRPQKREFNNSNSKPAFNRGGSKPGFNKDRRPRREGPAVEEKVWLPKTQLGKDVLIGKYSNMSQVLLAGNKVMEAEITDYLIPGISMDFINIGQAKGKFGGGKRKSSKATQKITLEGSKMSFSMLAVCGNKDGIVGLGFGKSRETVPSREKANIKAKKNLIIVRRGCGDWGCFCGTAHSIPFEVEGTSGSCRVKLIPAPKGTGLVAEGELKKLLELAGIKDIWCKSFGNPGNKMNFLKAGFDALKNLQKIRMNPDMMKGRGIKEGDKYEE